MANAGPQYVFISYARTDGAELALRLQKDLTAAGFDAWLDTQRMEGGANWTIAIEEAVDRAPVLLALLTPGSYVSEICRAEQLRSLRKGNCVIPLLAASGSDVPLHLECKNYHNFANEPAYAESFRSLLGDIAARKGVPLRELYRSTRATYITVPPKVANYMERPEAVRELRDTLFAADGHRAIALTALVGMGGIGKTVVAKALFEDQVVQEAFPDGLVWITVGREPTYNLDTKLREIARVLGDASDESVSPETQYRTIIADKAALIMIDDVWSKADLDPFLAESPRSRFVFTTRDASIARFGGACEHHAELLDEMPARRLLALWAGLDAARLPFAADDILRECGGLPLALSIMGALLRGTAPAEWADTAELLRCADLAAIEDQLPQGQHSFFRAIEISVNALSSELQQRYGKLAVLLDDVPATLPVLETLWNVGEAEARRIGRRLADRSLAYRDEESTIRLHDLQLDYVSARYPDRAALDLIHGAMRLSAHVIENDSREFASQVLGRLLPHKKLPAIQQFLDEIAAGAPVPWLRPLHPALHPPGTPLLRTLAGHFGFVWGVAVTPDGEHAVSAGDDHMLKVWDIKTGRAIRTLAGHDDRVYSVAVMPDGRRAVSSSYNGTLKVWDLETGRELRTWPGHSFQVLGVAVIPNSKRAVSASWASLKVWDLETGRVLRELADRSLLYGVAVTPDGKYAVSASDDKTVKVWDLETGCALRTLEGHSAEVRGVAVTPDGRRVVSASGDTTLRVWDLGTGRGLSILKGHSSRVNGVAVTADGKRAISASEDNTLKVWDLETSRALRTLEGHSAAVRGVAVTPDGRCAISSSDDHTLKVWDLETAGTLLAPQAHPAAICSVAVTPDSRCAVSASADNTLKVWDLETSRALRTLKGHTQGVEAVAVTPDGKRAVSASQDATLKVWDLQTGRARRTLKGHTYVVSSVAVTPDGNRAISGSWDRTLRVWDLKTGCTLLTLQGPEAYVSGVAVTGGGKRAVTASRHGTLNEWNLKTGGLLRSFRGPSDFGSGVTVTPDGSRAVSSCEDNTLTVWDLRTGRAHIFESRCVRITSLTVSADGKRILTASWDTALKLWDLDSGVLIAAFHCDAPANCCAFAADGRIVAGDESGRLYILSVEDSGP